MNSNIYKSWLPLDAPSGLYIVNRLEDVDEGLAIYLSIRNSDDNRTLKILFNPYIAYKNTDESYRGRTFCESGSFKNSLNIVEHSSWLAWFHEESLGYYKDAVITHYAIMTSADCIDILSEFPPEVSWEI